MVKDPEDPSNKVAVRYRLAILKNLHDNFNAESEYTCAYETFTRNVPFNVQKPEPSAWGTCLCSICLNSELKLESLQVDHLIKNLSNLSMIKDENIHSTVWQKVPVGGSTGSAKINKMVLSLPIPKFIKKLITDLKVLKDHLYHVHMQFKASKNA